MDGRAACSRSGRRHLSSWIALRRETEALPFPSTHVANYVATMGFASWLLWQKRPGLAVLATAAAFGMIALIGPSRVRTGKHRWSDVAGGYALGAAYLGTLILLARRDPGIHRQPGPAVTSTPTPARVTGRAAEARNQPRARAR
ncbi:MAG: phosphatase PAP2 family protein [Chloroflexi bacterium]|nr:phosphatase PAP2 family protein [Chloroflexota bacterium]